MIFTKEQLLAIISSTIIMIIYGSLYTFGAMIPYIYSYLYYQGHQVSFTILSIVYTVATVTINIGMIFDSILIKYLGNRQICCISLVILGVSIFLTSFMNQLVGYIIFFGIFNGIGMGIGYLCPLKNSYHFFPKRKGFCAGFCMAGAGFGSVIFNFIIVLIINPNNIQSDSVTKRFPEDVAGRVPLAFKFLAAVYLVFGLIGCLLMPQIKPVKKQIRQSQSLIAELKNEDQLENKNQQNIQIPLARQFVEKKGIFLFLIVLFMLPFPNFMAFAYKQLGFALNHEFSNLDHQLTIVGSIGILSNGLSRYIWGFLFDYFSFRTLLTIINVAMIISIATIQLTITNIYLYCIPVMVSFITLGGVFSILPTQTTRIFGEAIFAKLYWLIFYGFTVSGLIRFAFQISVIDRSEGNTGYIICIYIFGGFQVISALLCFFVKFQYNKEQQMKLIKRNQ